MESCVTDMHIDVEYHFLRFFPQLNILLIWCPKHFRDHDYLFVLAFSKTSNYPKAEIGKQRKEKKSKGH
jgi:hypothetical protein